MITREDWQPNPAIKEFQPKVLKTFEELSSIPSEFMKQIIGDVRTVLANDDVVYDGTQWVTVRSKRRLTPSGHDNVCKCEVCIAGATMLRRVPEWLHDRGYLAPEILGDRMNQILQGVNCLRLNMIGEFLKKSCVLYWDRICYSDWFDQRPLLFVLESDNVSKKRVLEWCDAVEKLADFFLQHGY